MDGGLLSLRWNDHAHTFFTMLSNVRKRGAYTDVTLACEGQFYAVHRLVLSTCSDYFDQMFERTDCKHPVVVVANIAHLDLEALLNYMYLGEINVLQSDLGSLMKAAEALRIKGLAEPKSGNSKLEEYRDAKRTMPDESGESKRRKLEDDTRLPVTKTTPRVDKPYTKPPDPPKPPVTKTTPRVDKPYTKPPEPPKPPASKPPASKPPASKPPATTSIIVDTEDCGGWTGRVREEPRSREQLSIPSPVSDNLVELVDDDDDDDPMALVHADLHSVSTPSPEVKLEEISVKDEPTPWYNENDASDSKYPSNTVDYGGGGGEGEVGSGRGGVGGGREGGVGSTAWAVMPGQVDSNLLLQGLPGTSSLAGDMIGLRAQAGYPYLVDKWNIKQHKTRRRVRSFVENWRQEFTWVEYNAAQRTMTCTTCLQYGTEEDKSSSFVSGNSNFKRLSLVRHKDSQIHQRCEARRKADVAASSASSPQVKSEQWKILLEHKDYDE